MLGGAHGAQPLCPPLFPETLLNQRKSTVVGKGGLRLLVRVMSALLFRGVPYGLEFKDKRSEAESRPDPRKWRREAPLPVSLLGGHLEAYTAPGKNGSRG